MTKVCNLMRSRWFMPASCLCLGGVVLLASWLGGQLVAGLIGLAVMACFGLFIALAGGSETIKGLRGDGRDERSRAGLSARTARHARRRAGP